jgi:hypothetical protein
MRSIRTLLLAALAAGTLATLGCQGTDYPGTDSTASTTAAKAAGPMPAGDTVTEHSELLYSDNLSGCYRWTWVDGARRMASPPGVCGMDLYLHEVCYNCPTGVITGTAYWFPGPDGTQPVISIQQNTQWSSSSAGWWEQDPITGAWYWDACSRRAATQGVASGWNCQLYEEDPFQPGHLLPAGTRTLFLIYSHAGN